MTDTALPFRCCSCMRTDYLRSAYRAKQKGWRQRGKRQLWVCPYCAGTRDLPNAVRRVRFKDEGWGRKGD